MITNIVKGPLGAIRERAKGAIVGAREKANHKYVARHMGEGGKWVYGYHNSFDAARTAGAPAALPGDVPHGVHPYLHQALVEAGAKLQGFREGVPSYHHPDPDAAAAAVNQHFAAHPDPDWAPPVGSPQNGAHRQFSMTPHGIGATGDGATVRVTRANPRTGSKSDGGHQDHFADVVRPKGNSNLSDKYEPKTPAQLRQLRDIELRSNGLFSRFMPDVHVNHQISPSVMQAVERAGHPVIGASDKRHIMVQTPDPRGTMAQVQSTLRDHGHDAINDYSKAGHNLVMSHPAGGKQQVTFVHPDTMAGVHAVNGRIKLEEIEKQHGVGSPQARAAEKAWVDARAVSDAVRPRLRLKKALAEMLGSTGSRSIQKAHVDGFTRMVNGKAVFVRPYETKDSTPGVTPMPGAFLTPHGPVPITGQTHAQWLGKQHDLRAATIPEHGERFGHGFSDYHVNDFIRRSNWVRQRNYGNMPSYVMRDHPEAWKAAQEHYDQQTPGQKSHVTVLKDRPITETDEDEHDPWDFDYSEASHEPGSGTLEQSYRRAQQMQRMANVRKAVGDDAFAALSESQIERFAGIFSALDDAIVKAMPRVALRSKSGLHFDAGHHRWMLNVPRTARSGWAAKRDHLIGQFNQASANTAQVLRSHPRGSAEHIRAKIPKVAAARALGMHLLGTSETGGIGYDAHGSVKAHSTAGNYTPERAATHEKIMRHFLDAHETHPDFQPYLDYLQKEKRPQAVFMTGGSGSGKGYVKKKRYGHHAHFVNIDPDEIKEHLAAADGLAGMHNYLPEHWHEESSDLAKKLQERAHQEKRSYIYDGVGGNAPSLIKKMQEAQGSGYRIHALRVHVDRDAAWKQNLARDRSVARPIFDAAHDGVSNAWGDVKKHVEAARGRAKVWDNRR